MRNSMTSAEWEKIGRLIGFERGTLDRRAGERQTPERLWVPDGVADAYVAGLWSGYDAGVKGQPLPGGDL